jgi:hypothetical protein
MNDFSHQNPASYGKDRQIAGKTLDVFKENDGEECSQG